MRPFLSLLIVALPAFAQPTFPAPKTFPPDEKVLAEIKAKTAELEAEIAKLPNTAPEIDAASVKVFHKAAVWIVRHGEWFTEKSGQQTLDVLNAGLERAKALEAGKKPWLDARDKPIALGYRSHIDDSIQPFSLRYPDNFDPKKKYRFDVVLHGRDGSLTEVKFLHGKETAKPGKGTDSFVMEAYGRGNNAYRWAGERDVFEAIEAARQLVKGSVDDKQVVIRGFSMGGAGTWHLGLHHPGTFAVMQPGAGFSATRGYHNGLEPDLPEYIAKGLHIYDAVKYAENSFDIPVVAYSGSKDPQKLAADNIENALKTFKEPHSFTHIVAPDLEHKQPPEWWAKCDVEIRKHLEVKAKIDRPSRVRFVTYTLQYARCDWVMITGLDEHYKRTVIDVTETKDGVSAKTENVRSFTMYSKPSQSIGGAEWNITVDGQALKVKSTSTVLLPSGAVTPFDLVKAGGTWRQGGFDSPDKLEKSMGLCGPIDHAFTKRFYIVPPTKEPWNKELGAFTETTRTQFSANWNKYLRGEFGTLKDVTTSDTWLKSAVLFGDPQSNPEIARILSKLPIQWTKDELVVNGVKYDAKTHVPMLIYPVYTGAPNYVVINSGHTFREDAFKGSNVLLYPRLGDWAVVKPAPTKTDPAAYEVVASGFFDEFWQFPKKK